MMLYQYRKEVFEYIYINQEIVYSATCGKNCCFRVSVKLAARAKRVLPTHSSENLNFSLKSLTVLYSTSAVLIKKINKKITIIV